MRAHIIKTAILTLFSLISLLFYTGLINASNANWLSTSSVDFYREEFFKVSTGNPAPFSYLSNKQDCTSMKFKLDTIRTNNVCAVRAANGMVSNDGYVLLHGSSLARKLTSSSTKHVNFIALRDSSKIVELKQVSNKLVVSIVSDAYILPAAQYSNAKYDLPFANKIEKIVQFAGTNIQLYSTDSISVSRNGKWLAGETSAGFFIYDIEASVFRYVKQAYGTSSDNTAISNDGKYVITTNKLNMFEITDTEQCENYSAQNGNQAKCAAVNYHNNIKQYLPTINNDVTLKKIQFDNNSQVSFYATHDYISSTQHTISKITMSLPGNSVRSYLALGDSFASGEGSYNYKAGTDFADNRCHLSLDSYPYLLYNADLGSMQSVACSGAKNQDYYYADEKAYNEKYSQAKNKIDPANDEEIFTNYLPGYRLQYRYIEQNHPDIVTISIGGNDIGFSKILQTCVVSANDCFDYYEERAAIVSSINNSYNDLVDTFTKIIEESAKDAHIYALGYPEIAKSNDNCATNVHLSNKEIQLGTDITAYLNSVIEMAATHAGVRYVDVSKAFYGNRLCETDSTDTAVNGLTAGNSAPLAGIGPIASESFHPNKKGHEMFAAVIKQQTAEFNQTMPLAVASNPKDIALNDIAFVANAPKKGSTLFDTYYEDDITEDVLYRNQSAIIRLKTDAYALRNDSPVVFELHSTPTSLGSVKPINGIVTTDVLLPNTMEPGYHTLHAYGTTIDNAIIDIQKIVYVAASEEDIDGDGVVNEDEKCLVGEPIIVDVDDDEIDDACDGYIGQPKATTKDLPQSESRPEWLLMKERDNAEEQAVANQSATISVATESFPPTTPESNSNAQSPPYTTSTSSPQAEAQPDPVYADEPNTTVAGVSSAIESKPKANDNSRWYIYVLVLIMGLVVSAGFYRAISVKNRV